MTVETSNETEIAAVDITVLVVNTDITLSVSPTDVKGGVIMDRRGGGERSGVALQNWTTRRLL